MAFAWRGALLRACIRPSISNGGGAARRTLASFGHLRLFPPSPELSPSPTTGYYAVPPQTTCRSERRRHRPLPSMAIPTQYVSISPGGGILSPPSSSIIIGTGTSSRLMSSSSAAAQYFEGPWYEKYLLLEQYKKEHGNCLVHPSFVHNDVKLGAWVYRQRQLYRKGKLSPNRREMLDALGFSWDPWADQWERNFALLEQYKRREGQCEVPRGHETNGIRLGFWLNRQRQAFKEGKLDESHQQRLEQLGVSWDPWADQWERNFALLKQFKGREGHCNVPHSHEEDTIRLGSWLDWQRQTFKKEKLDDSYQRRLEDLGVSWDPNADQWERNFALLEEFKKREGHCNVPKSHQEDGIKLGIWLCTQRQALKRGNLHQLYQRRLEELGVSWDPLEDQWERNLALLEQYKRREGHCNVPHSHEEDGIKLGSWLVSFRQTKKGNKGGNLSRERIDRLDEIGIRW